MFGEILASVMGHGSGHLGGRSPETERYVRWVTNLAKNAITRWTAVAVSGLQCRTRLRGRRGELTLCSSPAIAVCVVCQQGTCIDHAMVGAGGNAVCFGCVEAARLLRVDPDSVPAPPPSGPSEAAQRRIHLETLGLEEDVTVDEIHRAYKKAAAKHHPDKARDEDERKRRNEKLRRINVAYEWLTAKEKAA